ncbi:MAG: hypothetical protein J1G06_01760 [Oscillospiraceae bacterium]|nr:hypothetical protein [Oscillospiraceae bacterium]
MKKLIGTLIASSTLLFAGSALAMDYPAEIAEPSAAIVTVDGKPVDFCAYNLYGSNYFMLRDVAMSLDGTDKQFNVVWDNRIQLTQNEPYEPIGQEFSQSADSAEDAYLSIPEIRIDGNDKITLIGYNINGSNYFKIRDIARIFDFGVYYENGTLAIDTTKSYTPEMPYEQQGELIGMAYEADFALFINDMPIVSYYSTADTAYNEEQLTRVCETPSITNLYIDALDLENYGFDITETEGVIQLKRNRDKTFGMLDSATINSAPSDITEAYASDKKVYLDGSDTRNIIINGRPYISAAELIKYGSAESGKVTTGGIPSRIEYGGVNIEFLRSELESAYESADGEEISRDFKNEIVEEISSMSITGEYSYKADAGIGKLSYEQFYYESIEYIGGFDGYNFEGTGISRLDYVPPVYTHSNYYTLERGIFHNGKLYEGISYTELHSSAYAEAGGLRIEGSMGNGYRRQGRLIYNQFNGKFRFGYRIIREGTFENGKYVGYYREYDDNGNLIFEGDYSDFVQ